MSTILSKRLSDIVDSLPLYDGIRVLEIGCGPGAMAREISRRIGNGHILAIDRSAKAIQQAVSGSQKEIESGRMAVCQASIEHFNLHPDDERFDIAVAIRVGALDGRHPNIEKQSLRNIANVLKTDGKLYIDGGNPLKVISLDLIKKHSGYQ